MASATGPPPRRVTAPPMETRSFISVVTATRHPSPSPPRRAESGIRTSVKKTSLNSASPVIWKSGRTSTPGAFMSTRNAVIPLCLGTSGFVRATMKPERRDVGQGGPHLLAVEEPLVAVALGAGGQPGDVGARAGLAEELAPDLLVREEGPEVALLLLGCPVGGDGGGAHAVADGVAHPGHRRATGAQPRLRPLLVSRASGRARRAPSGKCSQARPRSNCSPRNSCAGVVSGGKSASRPSTSSSTFGLMPAPYSVLSCGHLLTRDGPGTRSRRSTRVAVTGASRSDGNGDPARRAGTWPTRSTASPTGFPVLSFHGGLSSRLDAAPAARGCGRRGRPPRSPPIDPAWASRPTSRGAASRTGRPTWPPHRGAGHRASSRSWAGRPVAPTPPSARPQMGDRVTAAALLSSAVPLDLYGTTRGPQHGGPGACCS